MAASFIGARATERVSENTPRSPLCLLSLLPQWPTLPVALTSSPSAPAGDADPLLIAIAHARDRGAFADLFRLYGPRLKSHLMGRGADAGTAEEIVQDVMLAVWRKAEQFDPARGSASAWIYTLARNAFVDRVRRDYRPQMDPADPLVEATEPGVDRLLVDAESQRDLAAAVDALPIEQQQIVRQSFFHGQSLAEISVAAGLPLGTVKTRARLALSHLRTLVTRRRDS